MIKAINSSGVSLVLGILLFTGCASTPMTPVAGMSIKELDRMAALSVLGGIKKYGNYSEVPEIEVYETYDQQVQRQRGKTFETGAVFYYFKDGRLISEDSFKELVEQRRLEVAREKEEQQKITQARLEIERTRRLEMMRMEDERRRKEEEARRIAEEKNRILIEIITKNRLKLIYQRDNFAIAMTESQRFVFIKDGEPKQRNQVAAELQEYERVLQAEKEAEARRKQNLSYRWVIQAVPAPYCRISRITEVERGLDGQANFEIGVECTSRQRPGYSGSSGTTRIMCCFGCGNKETNNAVSAVCQ